MGRRFRGLALCAASALTVIAARGLAQTAEPPPKPWPEPNDNPRDFNGIYTPARGNGRLRPADGSELPFQPWARELNDKRVKAEASNEPLVNTSTLCLPSGTPRIMTAPYPVKFITLPKEVVMLFEVQHLMRFVFLGEEHPKNLDPTFMGHSVGRWEGDTLVVDTVGLKDFTSLDQYDLPKSGEIHVVERLRKINGGKQIEDLITIDDPKAYTKPWTGRVVFDWAPQIRFIEYICEENNRNPVDANGVVGTKLVGAK
jgi:hypothetical protein